MIILKLTAALIILTMTVTVCILSGMNNPLENNA